MPTLILLCGMTAVSWYAWLAFRTRVSMSAIGSVMVMIGCFFLAGFPTVVRSGRRFGMAISDDGYQVVLVMPGSSPLCAISRTQTRQSPNLRYTALGRPHFWHRV